MTTPEDKEFFREGLKRYAVARETVTYFQESVQNAIARAFEQKVQWKYFEPIRHSGAFETGKGIGLVFLHSYIAGRVSNRDITKKAWLSLGVYWNAPLLKESSVVAGAQCWFDGGGRSLPFTGAPPGSTIKLAALYKRNEQRLVMTAGPDFDPDSSFGQLLDAADEALGPTLTESRDRSD